jgi:K+-sensing histidine kinase KdpD
MEKEHMLGGRRVILGYGAAIAAVVVMTLIRLSVHGVLEDKSKFIAFVPAVIFAAWFGGLGPGIVALVLASVAGNYYFAYPSGNFGVTDPGDILSFILFLTIGAFLIGFNESQRRARDQVRRLLEKTEEQNRRLEETEREVRALNTSLEERVEERTQELAAANRELEGFCYSIAHDMRTALRGIVVNARQGGDGLATNNSNEVRDGLVGVENAALYMSDLVDDLLSFARLGKRKIKPQEVDLTAIAQRTAAALMTEPWSCQELQFEIEPGLTAQGDPELLLTVMFNLMENAVKFCEPGQIALVKVGQEIHDGRRVFFVRDNGIGFNMKYVHKLFQPFQRLHRDVDFPGTGIGLANAKRVIERHGGEIWAEGEPGHGASFYFTFDRPGANGRGVSKALGGATD